MSNKPHKAEKKITKISAQPQKEKEPREEVTKTNTDQTKITTKKTTDQPTTAKQSITVTEKPEVEESQNKTVEDKKTTDKNKATKDSNKPAKSDEPKITKIKAESKQENKSEIDEKAEGVTNEQNDEKSNQDIKAAVLEAAQTDFAEQDESDKIEDETDLDSKAEADPANPTKTEAKTVTLGTRPPELPIEERKPISSSTAKKPKKSDKKHKDDNTDSDEKPLHEVFILVRPFVGIGRYLRDSWRELRQVRWPNRKTAWKMTLAVLVYCAIFIIFIMALDAFFTFIFNLLFS